MSNVRFVWPGPSPFTLSVPSFTIRRGEKLLLVGPSGSGKSTLLSLIAGVIIPQAGSICVLGQNLVTMRGAARDRFRAEHYGIIFQMFNLLPYGSVIDNVLLPLSFSASRRARAARGGTVEQEAARLLAKLGLDGALIHGTAAARLSVGQQQRVAAARALIGSPELIVADEPTSSLDRNRQQAFLDLLFAQVKEAGSTLVMVSHDESLGPRFDRVVSLSDVVKAERAPVTSSGRAPAAEGDIIT